jgi:hypothetical protein
MELITDMLAMSWFGTIRNAVSRIFRTEVPRTQPREPINTPECRQTLRGLVIAQTVEVIVSKQASVNLIEVAFGTGSQFIKFRHGACEIGGTSEWGTGTEVQCL